MMTQMMIEEATKFNTTVENLLESGFVWLENTYGDSHWFADCNGHLMSLAWFREEQRKSREFRKMWPAKRVVEPRMSEKEALAKLEELKKMMKAA